MSKRWQFYSLVICFVAACIISCNDNVGNANKKVENAKDTNSMKIIASKQSSKPGSSFNDTLYITKFPVVIFYNPDNKQLESFKNNTSPSVFQSRTHEYYFQQRNAKIVIKRDWRNLRKVETSNVRYIAFMQYDAANLQVVDLNLLEDISGMILWDGTKKPHPIDMMSVETELSYYFIKN